ncbi:hypothetical protein MK079_00060 [Candidatus Gracilibacteria bacterium]|nr:hypothetical protein [Candidatus Gracilibacteria bacterium]
MAHIFPFLLLLPLLAFSVGLLGNQHIFSIKSDIFVFGLQFPQVPFVLYMVLFLVGYCIILWGVFKFFRIISWYKSNKKNNQIEHLKAELHDKQPEFITLLEKNLIQVLQKNEKTHEKNLNTWKNEHDKILGNLEAEIKFLKDTIKKLNK